MRLCSMYCCSLDVVWWWCFWCWEDPRGPKVESDCCDTLLLDRKKRLLWWWVLASECGSEKHERLLNTRRAEIWALVVQAPRDVHSNQPSQNLTAQTLTTMSLDDLLWRLLMREQKKTVRWLTAKWCSDRMCVGKLRVDRKWKWMARFLRPAPLEIHSTQFTKTPCSLWPSVWSNVIVGKKSPLSQIWWWWAL